MPSHLPLPETCFSPYQFLFPANWVQTLPAVLHFLSSTDTEGERLAQHYAKVLFGTAFELELPQVVCVDVAGEDCHLLELHEVSFGPRLAGPELVVFEFRGKKASPEGEVLPQDLAVDIPLTYSRLAQFESGKGWTPSKRLPSTPASRALREHARMALADLWFSHVLETQLATKPSEAEELTA